MEQEIWKRVILKGEVTNYEVSNMGQVRHYETKRLRKQTLTNSGYLQVGSVALVHRAVAGAFIPTKDKTLHINHINGIKTDNRVENLEWVTRKQNMKHAFDNDLVPTVSPVEQYTLDGEFVKEYKSISEAVRENQGFTVSAISGCAVGKYYNAHGFQWRYTDSDKKIKKDKTKFKVRNQNILQYDLQGNYIKTFPNLASCYVELGKTDNGVISQVCKGKRHKYLGFQWRYENSDLPVQELKPKEKRVAKLDMEGNVLMEFESIRQASEHLGQRGSGAISQVCKGKKPSHLGYKWTYLD